MCILISSTVFVRKFLTLKRTERDLIKNYISIHVKYRLLLSEFNEIRIFSTDFPKSLNIKFLGQHFGYKKVTEQKTCILISFTDFV